MNNGMPIISLEISSMRHTVKAMLSEHAAKLDADIQRAVDSALTSEAIAHVIQNTVHECIKAAVKDEIIDCFRYSKPGRQAIREAVQSHMNEYFGDRE
jgi:hypothetical protein